MQNLITNLNNTILEFYSTDTWHNEEVYGKAIFRGEATPEIKEFFENHLGNYSEGFVKVLGLEIDLNDVYKNSGMTPEEIALRKREPTAKELEELTEDEREPLIVIYSWLDSIETTISEVTDPKNRTIQEVYEELKVAFAEDADILAIKNLLKIERRWY
jgi:hypothetical protein